MLPSEVGAAVRPAARGDHARPRHRRRYPKINFAPAWLYSDEIIAAIRL